LAIVLRSIFRSCRKTSSWKCKPPCNRRRFNTHNGKKKRPRYIILPKKIKIEGDTELDLEIKNLIDAIDLEDFPALIDKAW